MRLEVCIDSLTSAINAVKGGADRLEICGPLIAGGTTPSIGLVEAVDAYLPTASRYITYRIMLRSRDGDFVYNEAEKEVMMRDIKRFAKMDLSWHFEGFVVGAQLPNGQLDLPFLSKLLEWSPSDRYRHTLHRVSDILPTELFQTEEFWTSLLSCGIDTILTSGGASDCLQGVSNLAKLMRNAKEHSIIVMPGGGIKDGPKLKRLLTDLKREGFVPDWIHASGGSVQVSELGTNQLFREWKECDKEQITELVSVMSSEI